MGHEVEWEPKGVYRRFWGTVKATEYAAVQAQAYGDPRFDELRYILVDFSEATEFVATPREAEEIIATTVGAYLSNPKLRVAVVTTSEKLVTVLGQMGDLSAYPLRLFRTVAEAREWLDTHFDAPEVRRAARY